MYLPNSGGFVVINNKNQPTLLFIFVSMISNTHVGATGEITII